MFRLERWKAGALLGTWAAYWAALVGVTIGPGLLAAWRLTRQSGSHGNMSASVDGSRLLLNVNDVGGAGGVWTFNTSITAALAWIAGPPLVLWLVWLVSRPRRQVPPSADVAMLDAGRVPTAPDDSPRPERVERRP
jgi:hypothetical protein